VRLRSIVSVAPGLGGLDAALDSSADAVLFTVAHESRPAGEARREALEGIRRTAELGKRALVLVNHPRTRLLRDDLDALVSPALDGVLLAHAREPQDVRDLAVLLREFELPRGIDPGAVGAFPVIDSAAGLLRAAEIAQAAPRVAGLVFAAELYARDVGGRHEELGHRFAYARGAVVAAARGHDGLPLIIANPFELRDLAQQGFAGVILPDAGGVLSANIAFTAGEARLERARAHAAAYAAARAEGAWVARVDGEVVDSHAARKARQILDSG
jgi:citrate lyase beta subunit